jgi:hypothetical protein
MLKWVAALALCGAGGIGLLTAGSAPEAMPTLKSPGANLADYEIQGLFQPVTSYYKRHGAKASGYQFAGSAVAGAEVRAKAPLPLGNAKLVGTCNCEKLTVTLFDSAGKPVASDVGVQPVVDVKGASSAYQVRVKAEACRTDSCNFALKGYAARNTG